MKIFFGIFLLLIAFAMGASWGDMRSERIIKRLEFQNRMLKMDVHNLEETLMEIRRKENGRNPFLIEVSFLREGRWLNSHPDEVAIPS